MRQTIRETERRRKIQREYNQAHGITPETIKKGIPETLYEISEADYYTVPVAAEETEDYLPLNEIPGIIRSLEKEMRAAAKELKFEKAAELRDRIKKLKDTELGVK
jgi:excinuclease ABC subunit B